MSSISMTCALIVGLAVPVAADVLAGDTPQRLSTPLERPEVLFKGDLVLEMDFGCFNAPATWGGPNDAAQGVTATMTPPFWITSHFYAFCEVISPNITALSFVCWEGGDAPGSEFARRGGLDWFIGSHTVAISPPVQVNSAMFFFGQNQPQTNVGFAWGLDTTTSAELSFHRAPACGVETFMLVDALGFPGNWVMSVTVDQSTPVELQTWGALKRTFR